MAHAKPVPDFAYTSHCLTWLTAHQDLLVPARLQIATVCAMVSVGASILYRPKDKQVCL